MIGLLKNIVHWDINSENEQFGQWRAWERGISHIDMMSPWVKSLKVNNCHGVLVPRKMVN